MGNWTRTRVNLVFSFTCFQVHQQDGMCCAPTAGTPTCQPPFAIVRCASRSGPCTKGGCNGTVHSWTKSILQVHHGMGGDFVCMQELALAAQLLWTDTLGIEANHATIRRSLTVTSTQTHTMDVEELAISHLRIHRGESPQAEEGDCNSHIQGGAFFGEITGCKQIYNLHRLSNRVRSQLDSYMYVNTLSMRAVVSLWERCA